MRRELGSALFAAIVSIGLASAASARSGDGFCGGLRDRGRGPLLTLLGLTEDGRLVRFRECFPQRVKSIAPITGLGGADAALVGIDFRVKDGKLYGVGSGGGVYEIDPANGASRRCARSSPKRSSARASASTSTRPPTGFAS